MASTAQYFSRIPLVVPALILAAGLYFVFSIASMNILALRFSQSFVSIFTLIPFSIIIFGGVKASYAVNERKIQRKNTTFAMLDIGAVIVLIGLGMFIFYVQD